jgi:hypothetical protein
MMMAIMEPGSALTNPTTAALKNPEGLQGNCRHQFLKRSLCVLKLECLRRDNHNCLVTQNLEFGRWRDLRGKLI